MQLEKEKIGDLCLVGDGAHASLNRIEQGILYLTSKNFKNGGVDLTKVDYISQDTYDKYFRSDSKALTKPEEGDVLFSIIGTIGEPYLVKESDKLGISSAVSILRVNDDRLLPKYLYYWIQGYIFQDAVYSIKGGVAQSYVSLEMIKSLPLYLPSKEDQLKIISILSSFDDLIENNTRRIAILEEMARLIYREWFVHYKYPGHENDRLVDSGTDLGEVPEEWEVFKLEKVIDLVYGIGLRKKDRIEGRYPVYGSSGIIDWHDDYHKEGPGIVVGRKGNVGSVFWEFENFNPIDTTYYVESDLPLTYVFYNLQNQNFINNDAAVPGLSKRQANSLPVLIPDDNTLQKFDVEIIQIFNLIKNLNDQNDKLKLTRDLLSPKLISGKVGV